MDTYVYAYDLGGEESLPVCACDIYIKPPDTEAPTVVSTSICNISTEGYTVNFSVADNEGLARVEVVTWNDAIGLENAKSQYYSLSGLSNSASITVRTADFGGVLGTTYHSEVIACDTSGNQSSACRAIDIMMENTKPSILDCCIDPYGNWGYEICLMAADNEELGEIIFDIYTEEGTSKTVKMPVSGKSSGTVYLDINLNEYNIQLDTYLHALVYVVDRCGNISDPSNPTGEEGIYVFKPEARSVLHVCKSGEAGGVIHGSVNIYINDEIVAEDVRTFEGGFMPGSTYRIEPQNTNAGYLLDGAVNIEQPGHGPMRGMLLAGELTVEIRYTGTVDWSFAEDVLPDRVNPVQYEIEYRTLLGTQYSAECPGDGWTTESGVADENGNYCWKNYTEWSEEMPEEGLIQARYRARSIPLSGLWISSKEECCIEDRQIKLTPTLTPQSAFPAYLEWNSDHEDVASVDEKGMVTLLRPGAAAIICTSAENQDISDRCLVIVHSQHILQLPDSTRTVEQDAFRGNTAIEEVILPEMIRSIESGAFADCPNLKLIIYTGALLDVADGAFSGCNNITVVCRKNSSLADYCNLTEDGFSCYDPYEFGHWQEIPVMNPDEPFLFLTSSALE